MLDTTQTNLIGYASGGSMNRPVWQQLMDNVHSGKTVVVWKLDRLGRTLRGLLQATDRLDKIGASLRTMDGLIDMSSAMGRFNLHIMGAVSRAGAWSDIGTHESGHGGKASAGNAVRRPPHDPRQPKAAGRRPSATGA